MEPGRDPKITPWASSLAVGQEVVAGRRVVGYAVVGTAAVPGVAGPVTARAGPTAL